MKPAIAAIKNGKFGLRNNYCWNIEKDQEFSTFLLKRIINNNKIIVVADDSKQLGRFACALPLMIEEEIIDHIKTLEAHLFGLTCKELRNLAFEVAENNKIPHRFDRKIKMARKMALWVLLIKYSL